MQLVNLLIASVCLVDALVHEKSSFAGRRLLSAPTSSTSKWNMYFDDVSPHTYNLPDDNLARKYTHRSMFFNTTYGEMKAQVLRKFLLGHDAKSVKRLSKSDITQEMNDWAVAAGLVGDDFAKGEYDSVDLQVHSKPKLMQSCLVDLWRAIVDHRHTIKDGKLILLVFPYCEDLYHYDKLKMLQTTLNMSREFCSLFGRTFFLELFHPRYKNGITRVFSKTRHAPFPALGLEMEPTEEKKRDDLKQTINQMFGESEETEQQRQILEDIFMLTDGSSSRAKAVETESLAQQRKKEQDIAAFKAAIASLETSTQSTAGTPALDDVIDSMKNWFDAQRDHAGDSTNWWMVDSNIGEEAYLGVWSGIRTLEVLHRRRPLPNKSMTILLPNFYRHNPEMFKRFAVSVKATLEHLGPSPTTYSVQLYHPEAPDKRRQAPHPAIEVKIRDQEGR